MYPTMDLNDASSAKVPDPATRSHVYRLLAEAFRYPTVERFERYRNGDYLSELIGALHELPHTRLDHAEEQTAREEFGDELAPLDFTDLETSYIMTFDAGAPTPPCPPYEGTYREGIPRSKRLLAIVAFYRHFGLRMSEEESKHELPDHVSAELEFMHFLAFKEAKAREAGEQELLVGYVRAQRDFLARHLGLWLSRFADKLDQASHSEAFAMLARLAATFVERELVLVNGYLKVWGIPEEPVPPEPEPSTFPPIVPESGGCCPPSGG